MVKSRQRQRQLARAKWERQHARRSAVAARNRRIGIAVGVIVALVAAAALVWLIVHIVHAEDNRTKQLPSPSGSLTPTSPVPSDTSAGSTTSQPTSGTSSQGGATTRKPSDAGSSSSPGRSGRSGRSGAPPTRRSTSQGSP